MREEIKLLIQLQELDQAVGKLKATKEKLLAEAAETEQLATTAKQDTENRHEDSKSFRAATQLREIELKESEAKIARLDVQLNTVKTNKEYTAIQHEIAGLKADGSRIEDEILKMLEQVEADEAEVKNLADRAVKMTKAAQERRLVIDTALNDANAGIDRINTERKELAVKIPAKFLMPYERFRAKSDGKAMAACRGFVCDACRMALTANTVNRLMAGTELVYCHSCGRILYIADDEDIHGGIGAGRR